MTLICPICGEQIEPIPGEPGTYGHECGAGYRGSLDPLRAEIESLRAAAQQRVRENKALRADVADLQKTCAQLNDALTAAEQEIAGLEAEVERLRGVLEDFDPNDPQGFLLVIREAIAGKDGEK